MADGRDVYEDFMKRNGIDTLKAMIKEQLIGSRQRGFYLMGDLFRGYRLCPLDTFSVDDVDNNRDISQYAAEDTAYSQWFSKHSCYGPLSLVQKNPVAIASLKTYNNDDRLGRNHEKREKKLSQVLPVFSFRYDSQHDTTLATLLEGDTDFPLDIFFHGFWEKRTVSHYLEPHRNFY